MGKCALVIMTKAPYSGQVKTRLTPPLTPDEAAALNTCFLRDIANAIAKAGTQTQGLGCYTPAGSEEMYQDILPTSFFLLPQRGETLSQRLRSTVEDLFSIGYGSVCLTGSDNPMVSASTYVEAAEILSQPDDRVVLGPSDDGGYYLIGMKQNHSGLFEEIEWSTNRVLEQTLTRAAEMRLPVHLLPASFDVDDRETLDRLCRDLFQPQESEKGTKASQTKAFLQELMAAEARDRIWPGGAQVS